MMLLHMFSGLNASYNPNVLTEKRQCLEAKVPVAGSNVTGFLGTSCVN